MGMTKIEWADTRRGKSVVTDARGYRLIYCPSHPRAKSSGHVYEHRYVVERELGRFLEPHEIVHHTDGNTSNNDLANLVLTTQSRHASGHARGRNLSAFVEAGRQAVRRRKKIRRLVFCACGCGQMIEDVDTKGRSRRFTHGHNQRGRSWAWGKNG